MNRGMAYGFAAYILWGVLPIFWKLLGSVPSIEIVAHRILWSFPILLLLLVVTQRATSTFAVFRSWRPFLMVVLTAALLTTNWSVYIWGVNNDRIVDTSLGYFMNPLVNVLLGVIFLRERMRPWQWAAIGVAAAGVLWLTVSYGSLPWIGLTLAFSFGFYGLLKKTGSLDAIQSLSAEVIVLVLPMLALLIFVYTRPDAALPFSDGRLMTLLVSSAVFTVAPLLLFGGAARLIPLAVLGLIQYIAPTLQFILGVFVYHEPFSLQLLVGFVMIWSALGIYSVEGLQHRRTTLKKRFPIAPSAASTRM